MKNLAIKLSIPLVMLLGSASLNAVTLKETVETTMSTNPKVLSVIQNNKAFKYYLDEAKGGWYPKLDLTTYIQTKKTKINPDDGDKTSNISGGPNIQLDFEQLLYDGGLTTSEMDEAKFRDKSNTYANENIVDNVIFDSISAYLNMVKYQNTLDVTNDSLLIYEEYLKTAKDTAEISGEVLQKSQVNAKIHFTKSKWHEQTNNYKIASSSYERFVGVKPEGDVCRPYIDYSLVPKTLKEYVDQVIVKNNLILEQVVNIKEQRAVVSQRDASFYPTIKFKAQGLYDRDNIEDKERTQLYTARIELKYNLYNGNIDKAKQQRERLFLEQVQKELDVVTKQVIDEATAAYTTFNSVQKQIDELKLYIKDNEQVLAIFKDQFEGGTRTFIDVLNIERDLNSAKESLVAAQFDLDLAYFSMFNSMSQLKESVLYANNNTCERKVEKKEVKALDTSVDEELVSLLDEGVTTKAVSSNDEYVLFLASFKNEQTAKSQLAMASSELGDEYKTKIIKSNGFNTVIVYDVNNKDEIVKLRDRLSNKFPGLYFRKTVSK